MSIASKSGLKCPKCKRPVSTTDIGKKGNPFPFCSERCKMTDLGIWLEDSYKIEVDESGNIGYDE